MPSQRKKKDTVSKNMGARYAPIERALRSTPHIIVCDVSGSQTPAPLVMAQFQTPQPEAPRVFFNPSTLSTSASGISAAPAPPQPSTSDASNTVAGKDANSTGASEKATTAPAADDDSKMEWESADSN